MPFRLILLILLFAEIAAFILVGRAIGVLPTLALTAFAMLAGMVMLRRQGIATVLRVREELVAGRSPGEPLFNGALLAGAALLLIVPGFIGDMVALALLVPRIRGLLWDQLRRRARHGFFARGRSRPPVIDLDPGDYAVPAASKEPEPRKTARSG